MTQDIRFKLAADGARQTQSEIDGVGRAFASLDGRVGATATSLKNAAATFGRFASLAGGAAAAGFALLARRVADGLDSLNDLAESVGGSVENLSALEDVALRTGSSLDTVATAIVRMNKSLSDAASNKEIAASFKALGLEVGKLKQLDPALAFQQLAIALDGFADDANKARIVQELFGKSLLEVNPLLKDVAAAGQLNATVTKEQGVAAAQFNDAVASLNKDLLDLSRTLAGPLITAINDFSTAMKGLKNAGGARGFFGSIGKEIRANLLTDELRVAMFELESIQRRADFGETGLDRRRDALRAYISSIQREMLAVTDELKGFASLAAPLAADYSNEGRNSARPSLPSSVTAANGAAAKKAAADRLKLATESAQAILDVEEQAAKDAAEAWKFWEKQQIDAAESRADAVKLQWQQVFEFIDQEQERAIEEGQAAIRGLGDDSKAIAQDLALVFSSAAGEAIKQWTGVKDLLKGILQDIAQIVLKKTVTDPLGKAVGGFIDSIDFGSIFKGAIPSFAVGTPYVPRDMLAVVHKGERIVPAAENRAGASSTSNMRVVINVAAGANPDEWRRSQRQILADLQRGQRRAGGIA